MHLCHPKEEFIRNEEGPKGKENIHLPAVSKCCLLPDKESSLNVTSVSAQAIVMVLTWLNYFFARVRGRREATSPNCPFRNSLIMKLSGKRIAIDSRWCFELALLIGVALR